MLESRSLQEYLNGRFPLSKAMGVEVLEASVDGVKLAAPLSPNINHNETVFGGSASAVAILSAWSLLYLRLINEKIQSSIVIRRSSMNYKRLITDTFTASSCVPDPSDWFRFLAMFRRKRRAGVRVNSVLHCKNLIVGEFEGDFAAIDVQAALRKT